MIAELYEHTWKGQGNHRIRRRYMSKAQLKWWLVSGNLGISFGFNYLHFYNTVQTMDFKRVKRDKRDLNRRSRVGCIQAEECTDARREVKY